VGPVGALKPVGVSGRIVVSIFTKIVPGIYENSLPFYWVEKGNYMTLELPCYISTKFSVMSSATIVVVAYIMCKVF